MLLVGEDRSVEVRHEGVSLFAVDAVGWLDNAAHLHCSLLFSETLGAGKVRLFHFGHNVTVANHNTSQRNEFLDVSGS